MSAADWLVRELKNRGVEWIATLCGHGLDPLFAAARGAGIRLVDTRNEQTAAYIAECAGRLTRRPGVCACSSGIAQVNALTGVVNAYFDGAPMLLLSGAAAHRTAGMGHFQDLDQAGLAAPVTKYSRVIASPERTVQMLSEALDAAAAYPPGPAHLVFPMDVQNAPVAEMIPAIPATRTAPRDDVDRAARAIEQAERPLIVAGSGCYYAGAGEDLLSFAERFSVPVVTPIWDRGSIERVSPVFLGVAGAATGGARLLADSDCVLVAGAAADYRLGYLATGVPFLADWNALAEACHRTHAAWLVEARRRCDEFRESIRETGRRQAQAGTHAIDILDALEPHLRG
ncbi:MAG: thiamine pyrophosphate-binding protein, partial [Bryobacteraceae bacterium]